MPSADDEILRVVKDVLGPLLRVDGAKLYVVQAGADAVVLHLAGRSAGCPGNTLTTRRIIEPAILAVAPKARVTVTAGALIPKGARLIAD
jgi:Fe-S cluster biogenesis protein NfuA